MGRPAVAIQAKLGSRARINTSMCMPTAPCTRIRAIIRINMRIWSWLLHDHSHEHRHADGTVHSHPHNATA